MAYTNLLTHLVFSTKERHPFISPPIRSIDNQEAHHHKASFQDEFRALLKRHGIVLDERYIWL
jgi:hypothetical protein